MTACCPKQVRPEPRCRADAVAPGTVPGGHLPNRACLDRIGCQPLAVAQSPKLVSGRRRRFPNGAGPLALGPKGLAQACGRDRAHKHRDERAQGLRQVRSLWEAGGLCPCLVAALKGGKASCGATAWSLFFVSGAELTRLRDAAACSFVSSGPSLLASGLLGPPLRSLSYWRPVGTAQR